jgi:hypothetical protein
MQLVFRATIFGSVLAAASIASAAGIAPPVGAASPTATPAIASAEGRASASAAAITSDPTFNLTNLTNLTDADGPRVELGASSAPADIPVEAIPTPSAVSLGAVAMAGLAAHRLFRRLRLA